MYNMSEMPVFLKKNKLSLALAQNAALILDLCANMFSSDDFQTLHTNVAGILDMFLFLYLAESLGVGSNEDKF